ncbi:hypothetical protein NL676_004334 [Syzygium grande]|nr:hypothetical protein NL676_004334 [Syzygium grande]
MRSQWGKRKGTAALNGWWRGRGDSERLETATRGRCCVADDTRAMRENFYEHFQSGQSGSSFGMFTLARLSSKVVPPSLVSFVLFYFLG